MMGVRNKASTLDRYVGAVTLAGFTLLFILALWTGESVLPRVPLRFALFVSFIVLGELFPIRVPRRGHVEEITTSTTFAFAWLLIRGAVPALFALGLASAISDLVQRKPFPKIAFNVAQYALSLGAAALVQALVSDLPNSAPPHFQRHDLFAVVAAGMAFFAVNHVLTGVVMALAEAIPVREMLRHDVLFEAMTTGVLLALAPIVVLVADADLLFVPLLALPLIAIQRGTRAMADNTRLVDDLREQAAANEYQALHDALTGLPNRTLFNDRVRQALLTGRRQDKQVAVMIMDLDRFKEINDTLGHHNGDRLLQQVAGRLIEAVRISDTIARLGGDEFGILLPSVADLDSATEVAQKLLRSLEKPFVLDDLTLHCGATIGITIRPDHGDDADVLIQRADVAMYVAKQGRRTLAIYDPSHDHHSPERLALGTELRHGIDHGELFLVFQPQVELVGGRVTGVEALVRWRHPHRGVLSPDEFVSLAERTGLIKPLTHFVLDAALRQIRLWQQQGMDVGVAVNLSMQDLLDLKLADDIGRRLAKWGVPASALELEITESSIMTDPERVVGNLTTLSKLGVRLAVDDFGTGYSSLAYLKRLPIDTIKIDKSFVQNMTVNDSDAVIVTSIIDLGKNLGLAVVAEGVESEEILEELAYLGCETAQGFGLCRPVPPEQFTEWFSTQAGARGTAVRL
jgi:diguanylate cyclase (GGDEF)-like protein